MLAFLLSSCVAHDLVSLDLNAYINKMTLPMPILQEFYEDKIIL